MLFFIAVLAFLSAAFLLFQYSRRQTPELPGQIPNYIEPPPNARPLFAPSDADLRREADLEKARFIAKREYQAKTQSRAAVDEALANWRRVPRRSNATELLRVTAESGLEGDFSRAANEILIQFRGSGIDGLTADDLAALLDSHSQLLSSMERGSGELFLLRQEIAKLRNLGPQAAVR
jgi:hypothetical protein